MRFRARRNCSTTRPLEVGAVWRMLGIAAFHRRPAPDTAGDDARHDRSGTKGGVRPRTPRNGLSGFGGRRRVSVGGLVAAWFPRGALGRGTGA